MPNEVTSNADLKPGDFYEDAFYHPCLCLTVDYDEDHITGISLIDGSWPRSAGIRHGFVRRLSFDEVAHYKFFGPIDATLSDDKDWTKFIPPGEDEQIFNLLNKN